MQYHAIVTTLPCQCIRDLDPLRRKRLERNQYGLFQGHVLKSWVLRRILVWLIIYNTAQCFFHAYRGLFLEI